MDILLLAASVVGALAVANALRLSQDERPRPRAFLGRRESWRDDGTADATSWLFGMPVLRHNWTHSTWLRD